MKKGQNGTKKKSGKESKRKNVQNIAKDKSNEEIKIESVQSSTEDDSDYDLIDLKEPWANIYYLLKQSGWKHCNAPSSDLQNTHYFLAPNAPKSKRDCIRGQHIFHNPEAVIKYIRKMKKRHNCSSAESRKYDDEPCSSDLESPDNNIDTNCEHG